MEKKKNTSKTPKTYKYYYSKASIIRSALLAILCFALFVGFFACFMIYGGKDRNPSAAYKIIQKTEKNVLSQIDGVAADGKGRVYVFYSRTFDINVYDEKGNFIERYQIPSGETETIAPSYDGGIACMDGKLYAFNDVGEVFVFEDGKGVKRFTRATDKETAEKVYKEYDSKKDKVMTADGKIFKNNFVAVSDGEGNVIVDKFWIGLLFSPFSMIMAIIMTVLTYLCIRRYNKKVRNQKIKTIFQKNIIIK